ncbi:MAG TPA: SPOR domain-containing protein, partial [Pseudolabrys sp.]|nr:SPOR domain-containing protein [Pseudolabrys sp.]
NITSVITSKNGQPPTIVPSVPASPTPEAFVAKTDPDPKSAPATKMASAAPSVPIPTPQPEPAPKQHTGWIIQIGALPDEKDAWQRLELAQTKAKNILGKADPFTERVEKGEKVLFRARFAGLEKNQAEAACKHLKRSDIPCMMLKN